MNDRRFRSSTVNPRRVIPSTSRGRDALIAVAVGLAVLGFVVCALFSFSRQAATSTGVDGIIVAKQFIPQPEKTQITFGRNGLSRRNVTGEYHFRVRVPQENNRIYTMNVSPQAFAAHETGDHFYFLRDPSATARSTLGTPVAASSASSAD